MRLTAGVLMLASLGAAHAQPRTTDDPAAIAAAMKRAQLLAAGPMRAIVEAGKLGRREVGGPSPDAVAAPRVVRPARQLSSVQLIAAAAVPVLTPLAQEQGPVDIASQLATPPQPTAFLAPPDFGRPRLISSVEPDIPAAVRRLSGSVNSVQLELTLRPDGSVADVALLQLVPRSWQRPLREALLQWRFDPQPATRLHRVQLVFQDP